MVKLNKFKSGTGLGSFVGIAGMALTMVATESPALGNPDAVPSPRAVFSSLNIIQCKPCNPCAAKKCNPCAAHKCNPCAAHKCNPCAAKNPCNPCAAQNPCNPCGASSGNAAALSKTEAQEAYNGIKDAVQKAFAGVTVKGVNNYQNWAQFNTSPYVAATHGGRLVNNYVNPQGRKYGQFEKAGKMPVGAVLIKDSIEINGDGSVSVGPLFVMEKMRNGFNRDTGNWKYSMYLSDGSTFGVTNGVGSNDVQFCADCHFAAEDNDYLFFLPDDVRKTR